MDTKGANCQEIAIIGSGCCFPGRANSPSQLWNLVRDPSQLAEPIPLDRFSVQGFYHESGQYHGHFNVKEAYFLAGEGVHRRFDAPFFGMNPAEAMCLDPQCRLLLETVYEALEGAGLTIEKLQGSNTAVYTGQMVADYDQIMMRDSDDSLGTYHASGTSHAIFSNRIFYFFDWHGPSMTIDTACSSSLVAVHQVVQQLRTGHSRVAIAAGANLLMDPKCFISLSSLTMLSPDGRSRMWDADAKGFNTGLGCSGRTMQPKTQLIRDCYLRAGLDLANTAHRPRYFECHGTGTLAGDAAEAKAISSASFPKAVLAGTDTGRYPQRLVVGSIKSIIGHTEGTVGLAGILKASLALQNATLPPNLLFNRLNPRIKPFYNDLKLSVASNPWPFVTNGSPRRASLNSFGIGGANVHAILESYETGELATPSGTPSKVAVFTPFVFSVFSEISLVAILERWYQYLRDNSDSVNLRDLAYTLHSRRTCFQVTTAIVAPSVENLSRKIAKFKDAEKDADTPTIIRIPRPKAPQSGGPRFLGIITGQGAQFAGMGIELLKSSKVASQVIERLETRLLQLPIADRPTWPLMQELEKEPSSSRIAYHSYHMLPCSEAYLNSMAELDVYVDNGGRSTWFSSVLNGEDMSGRQKLLKGTYCDSNMIRPVQFEKAITNACTVLGPFDCALEVGPHPTLKGPALQTIQEVSGTELPYTGLFHRSASAIESVAEGFGYIWSRLGKDAIDLQRYDQFVTGGSPCRLLKGLPTYAWNHDEYWNESRYAKAIRLQPGPVHELLGHMTPDSNEQDMRWRHVLKPTNIPWLMGHRLQNQIVFPAAGYASRLELSGVEFGRALVFEVDDSNVKVVTSLADIVRRGLDLIEASFRYHAADGKADSSLNLMATARVTIFLGEAFDKALPARAPKPPNLLKVRPGDFCAASRDLEYQWAGPFVTLDKLERKLGATVEGLECFPLSRASAHDDIEAFATVVCDVALPDPQLETAADNPIMEEQREPAEQFERMAGYIVRKLVREAPADYSSLVEGHHARLLFASEVISSARAGHIVLWRPKWENETYEQLMLACQPYAITVEMKILRLIGDSLPDIFEAIKPSIKLDNALTEEFFSDALGPVEPNRSWAAPHLHKMVFKTLDIRQNPVAQGFVEHSYDLIVASLVLYSKSGLEQTLQNARRLLKPGGHLAILELTQVQSSVCPLIFGAIPGLWLGADEDRVIWPGMSLSDWDHLLQGSGFSSYDTSTPATLEQSCIAPFTVLLSQAMDGKMSFLRSPLKFESDEFFEPCTLIEELVIIGGASFEVAQLIRQIKDLVQNHCGNIRTIRTLSDLPRLNIASRTTVLSLTELEVPIFQQLNHEQWEALKGMIIVTGVLLWITHGRRARNPFANIMSGIMRSVIREVPTISYQMLDFEDASRMDPHSLSEALLRLQAEIVWQRQDNMRTSIENEVVLNEEGQLTIPRLIINKGLNDRYNSSKRAIRDRFKPHQQNISIVPVDSQSGYELMQEPEPSFEDGTVGARMEVKLSLLSAVRVAEFGCMFLKPERGLATILANDARLIGVHVVFVTVSLPGEMPSGDPNWLNIHPPTADRVISRLLPTGISAFVNFAVEKGKKSVSSRIQSLLSSHCRKDSTKTLFTDEAWVPPDSQIDQIQKRLQDAMARATLTVAETNQIDNLMLPRIQPGSLAEPHNSPAPFSLIDWTECSDVAVKIRSIDTQISFSRRKTYWFAGLSGGLGLALCDWMARHGANYFVISSRQPKIHDSWCEMMRELGVVLKIASCDVTIKDQVTALHSEICRTMPPIAGVVQGSMVLEDTAIRAMTVENFLRGTKPKVEGSIHLNDLFQESTLDFFVFFSSIVSVIGRPGQCNYSGANAFMTSLAEQRRRRGLAASIIHIGPIYGIGYAAQLEEPIYSRSAFRSTAMIPTCERDFYQLFAEALIAGRPGSSWNTVELFSGARRISKHDVDRPVWEAEPLMSHFVRNSEGFLQAKADSQSRVPLRMQLARAYDRGQLYELVLDAFLPKLYSLFQLDPSKATKDTLVGMRLDEMGIDSLLAVGIRGWFMKTIEANIPVLKILSGIPIGNLIVMATNNIPKRLVPNLESNEDTKPEVDALDLAAPHKGSEHPETDSSSTPDSCGASK
ncbi:hypothetical protein JMJ35_010675 [Cladonia borealis]|uniref:Polyketide synthase n=1 Tax=Cladonia borealis TaxID=184061 RepID=A0AA39QRZ7_9LECA|nr:hypothetical protein JMJ35_010675 [Cladonia borealis]